ncbi:Hypothetical protein FKW44_014138 [Caligus rogercresseyi]|uniref:Uncharacterized protein n=1 Tax=Caligus rogercresseyi TaxID=217165 RepID=A0A7T8GYH3_CALRO|nr:Hypothetical protein FKW44_014138 [Caligus rogercresseyi]
MRLSEKNLRMNTHEIVAEISLSSGLLYEVPNDNQEALQQQNLHLKDCLYISRTTTSSRCP